MGCGLCFWASEESKTDRENSGKRFKIFFFPTSVWAWKKENSAVQNDIVLVFFFLKKRKCNLKKPKNRL
jgi:hypothetical protein